MRAAFAVALVLVACGGDKTKAKDHHDDHGDEHAGSGEHHDERTGEPSIVRIAPEMIRDLRVTTAKAEARAAGERASVLAELRINQDAYAEVASPSPSRVVRVLVKAGDDVKANQALIELTSGDMSKARAEASAADARLALARKNLERCG